MDILEVKPFSSLDIQFKELNHSDFIGYEFEESQKTIIEPNESGFISDNLNDIIDLNKNDTTIINASVGQGKTVAILKFIERYFKANKYHNENFLIVVITPFKSLNVEYKRKITESSQLDNICFDYQELEEFGVSERNFKEFIKKPIQLISIKSILGDPGTIAPKQSDIKRKYYEALIESCKKQNKKVIFIFDEIHESTDSFNPRYIFNLFKWREVVHKIIVSSATFSESSKVAIKFLAELTKKRIKIYETKRGQANKNLSELHLCINEKYTYKADDPYLKDLILSQIDDVSKVHILTYSKKLAKGIYESEIGKALINKFGDVNLFIGGKDESFNHKSCNIGTRFKTGISIEDENCAFFVILPSKFASNNTNKNSYGIFTDRINSIIQAVARPRKKSKIFIISPTPEKLILIPDLPSNYIKETSINYLPFNNPAFQTHFLSLNNQDSIFKEHYNSIKEHVNDEIKHLKKLDVVANYPDYEVEKLFKGDDYLGKHHDNYGKNLSNYIYWAVWNNQFVNCTLKSIIKMSTYKFSEGNIQNRLDQYFNHYIYTDSFFTLNSDRDCYQKIRASIFSNSILYKKLGEQEYYKLGEYRNFNFEQQIITFIQRKKKEFNFEFNKLIYPPNGELLTYKNGNFIGKKKPIDIAINLYTYLRLAISHSLKVENVSEYISAKEYQLINSYKSLHKYQSIILDEYSSKTNKADLFLPIDSAFVFKKEHSIELQAILDNIKNNDENLKAFSISQKKYNDASLIKLLRDIFFIVDKSTKKGIGKINTITKVIEMPSTSEYINLIYNIDNAWLNNSGYGEVQDEFSNDPNFGNFV